MSMRITEYTTIVVLQGTVQNSSADLASYPPAIQA